MNVGELRKALSVFPDEMEVLRDDDEGGPGGILSVRSELYPQWSAPVAVIMKAHGVEPKLAVVIE